MTNEKKQLVIFGYGLAVILVVISFHVFLRHGWHVAHIILFPCIIGLVLVTAIRYLSLKPLYKQWMKAAHFIGSVITGIILSILFYAVFGITGMILRLMRKDLLDRSIDRSADTYWIKRESVAFNKDDYIRQF